MSVKRIIPALLVLGCFVAGRPAVAADSLIQAAARGDLASVRDLVKRGADVNAPDADGATALHWAVRADDLETTDALIRAGAKATAATRLGITPLYLAAENGNAAIIRRLLEAGADAKTRRQQLAYDPNSVKINNEDDGRE